MSEDDDINFYPPGGGGLIGKGLSGIQTLLCVFNTLFALHAYPGYTAHYLTQLYLLKIKLCSKILDNYI